ncbi:hypothetical protein GBA52_009032 [Prunus armeniaca]|nr:hypothetical protein GBA52_009032 [Prunus armeniaca]
MYVFHFIRKIHQSRCFSLSHGVTFLFVFISQPRTSRSSWSRQNNSSLCFSNVPESIRTSGLATGDRGAP